MQSLSLIAHSRLENSVEDLIDEFEGRRASGEISLEDFWIGRSESHPASTLAALIKLDLQRRFERGERPRIAEYLDRFPILREDGDKVVSLVYEEFCLRQEIGEDPDSREFSDAYGPWRDSIMSQLAYHRDLSLAVGAQPSALPFPAVGDQFDKYQLIKILGTGAVARVYLATEDDLGGRKLVIKVSESFGQEPTILARLKHRNIVPILTFARSDSGLRGICMPYRAGLTLDDLIQRIGRGTPPPKARTIREVLRSAEKSAETPLDDRRPGWDKFPLDRTFPDAIAWIGLALSDALEYLHSQGVLHRDIKPANILLAHEDGPQLLDFNLSQDPEDPENVSASMKGGTLPYMAPEQLQAFLEVSDWKSVGHSADLFSLGLVLRELATGSPPDLPDTKLSLPRAIQGLIVKRARPLVPARQINPLIPPSLDAILEKCLAFDTSDRYDSAKALSEDLRQFLDRKTLKHTRNPSKAERGVNWFYRNRLLVGSILVSCLVLMAFLILRTPVPIPDRTEFRRAVILLDSNNEVDLEKARLIFNQFHRDYPESAWPSLYLALTLDRLNQKNAVPDKKWSEEVSLLMTEADKKPDAEEALRRRIKEEPNSVMLLLNCATLLLNPALDDEARLLKSQRDEDARQMLLRALELEPNRMPVLTRLIKLERAVMHHDRAAELTSMAIAITIKLELGWDKVYAFRNIMISCLSKLADQAIEEGATSTARLQAAPHLDAIESTLETMSSDLKKIPTGKGADNHLYLVEIYQGCVTSGRGVLAADSRDFSRARALFDAADQHFKDALKRIPGELSICDTYRKPVDFQTRLLKGRRERFLKSQKPEKAKKP
jgi:serine/threonine protein kinase